MKNTQDDHGSQLAPETGYTPGKEPRVNEGMAGGGRWFKVLIPYKGHDYRLPGAVPWALVAPHARQADINHGQTLERLNERGGLSIRELHAVCHDKAWHPGVAEAVAVEWLLALMWNGAQGYIDVRVSEPAGGEEHQ